jgi:pantetheine-phosphate adenylyltransferase
MQQTIVFPGSFDPMTLGHEDLIARASQIFPQVIVAIAEKTSKNSLLDHKQRVALAKDLMANKPGIEVMPMRGLLVDFLKENNCHVVLRGMRNGPDMHYEQQMFAVNSLLMPEMETVFLWSRPELAAITSSSVREIISYKGDISAMVSAKVLSLLKSLE